MNLVHMDSGALSIFTFLKISKPHTFMYSKFMVLNMYIDKIMRNVYKKSSSKKYLNFGKFKKHFCNTIYYHLCQKFVFFILFKLQNIL
jgi:hypothetical protein